METQVSPISQLLYSLGMTREDLNKRSLEMRQFLTANDSAPSSSSRVPTELTSGYRSRSSSDLRQETRSASSSFSLARSESVATASSKRDTSPPSTPVKTEHTDSGLPSRAMDSMEIIIERQRQSRKGRKSRREKDRSRGFIPPPSPSPSSTSASAMSLDSFMQTRDDRPLSAAGSEATSATTPPEVADPPPVTPQKSKYYREHTMNMSQGSARKNNAVKTETPTPTKPPTRQPSLSQPQPAFYTYPPFAAYGQYMPAHYPMPQASTSALPVTPQTTRIINPPAISTAGRKIVSPSSPAMASSSPPTSSPAPHHINMVSSPGPMGSSPVKDQEKLPFKLPQGPYSPKKPDLSYAALVGQAILASADHRLTLQEIYDFITIVYPHYKRGETTWMNSIRHVLSTTACFRKVPRDRSVGRTLWAIYDEDLECFKGGGFKKQLCKDIMKQQAEKDKKNKARKRSDEEEDNLDSRKSKKPKIKSSASSMSFSDAGNVSQIPVLNPQPSFLVAGTSSHPFFPRPTPHHQPYYESCLPQPQLLPAEVIFPPLPPTAALASRAASTLSEKSRASTPPPPIEKTVSSSTNTSTTSLSSLSMPELTPNRSSSTSPPSSALNSDVDMEVSDALSPSKNTKASSSGSSSSSGGVAIVGVDDDASSSSLNDDDDNVFNSSLLGPVSFWGESPGTASLLQPAVELLNFDAMASDEEEDEEIVVKEKQKIAAFKNYLYPGSPTPKSRAKASSSRLLSARGAERPKTPESPKASTSTSTVLPSTPPRRVKLSSVRTPISHKGLHMSPSASLAHYKSNLDPPRPERLDAPPVLFSAATKSNDADDDTFDPLRTPRRRTTASGASTSHVTLAGPFPETPNRNTPSAYESIFRTPTGSSSFSPFRTPGSRSVLDPNDPRVLLDDEVYRQSQLVHDSPGGIFGKGKLLYESPGFGEWSSSPGKKYWW